jgi:hypothetical protein
MAGTGHASSRRRSVAPRAPVAAVTRVLAVAVLVGLLPGCGHRAPLLTPTAARQILQTERQLNEQANGALDIDVQDRHETGAAARIDDDAFRRLREAGKTAVPDVYQVSAARTFVPRQYRYPAEFLGQWTETYAGGAHGTSVGLFVRPTPADPWRATLYLYTPSDSPDPLPDLVVDRDGYATRLSFDDLERLNANPDRLAREVADFWNGYADPAFALTPMLAPGTWTTTRNEETRGDVAKKSAQNQVEQFSASPGPYRYDSAYRTRFGGALLFISVVEHIVVAVVPPMSLVTPVDYRGRQVLPLAVTKGAHEVWVDVLHLIAVDVPPGGRQARLIDGYSGPIAAARVN